MNGRTASLVGFVLLLGSAWLASPGSDGAPAPDTGLPTADLSGLAVLDVGRVFREYGRFNQQLAGIREEIEEAQQRLALRQVEIEATQRELQGHTPGTAAYERAQRLLLRLQNELQSLARELQQEVAQQEAALFSRTYRQVLAHVRDYAQRHALRLVLRTHEPPVNTEDRASVMGWVNREVIYQQGLDITDAILAELNAEPSAAGSADGGLRS